MEVKQHFVIRRPRSLVWEYFGRIDKVTLCIPGASLDEPPAGNQAKFKFNVKLGPITAAFIGDAELQRDPANFRGTIRGSGRDSRGNSRARGVLEYALAATEPDTTYVEFRAEFYLTGALAQFSRASFVQELAVRLATEFAQNVDAALTAEITPELQVATLSAATETSPNRPPPTINAGELLLATVWDRLKVTIGKIFIPRNRG